MDAFFKTRAEMVEKQIRSRGICDESVLDAMRSVPRHLFVDPKYQAQAYEDRPLPIGAEQTISQPYIVGLMVELLKLAKSDRVLEIGAGSGYAAAILAEVANEVFAIERIPSLANFARRNFLSAGYPEIHVRCSDGTAGWPEEAPFDAILVSAGATDMPMTLATQLRIGGRLVVPIGPGGYEGQELKRITRTDASNFRTESFGAVRFVPLVTDVADSDLDPEIPSAVDTR